MIIFGKFNFSIGQICMVATMLFSLFGCHTSSLDEFSTFPRDVHLKARQIEIPPVLSQPMELVLLENILVGVDVKSDFFFHVFQQPDMKYTGSFIRRGHGPDEEIFINPRVRKISGNQFFYQTFNHVKDVTYDTQSGSLFVSNSLLLEGNLFSFQHMFKLGSSFLGWNSTDTGEKEYKGFDPKTEQIFEFGPTYPDFGQSLQPDQKKMLADKNITVKPDQSKLAAAYLFFPLLRIMNSGDGSLVREIQFQNGQLFPEAVVVPKSSKHQQDVIMNNYRAIKSTDNYIYVLYVGKVNKELLYPYDDFNVLGDHSNEIHVFDWAGNPAARIFLNRNIFCFEVDPVDQTLVALSITNPDSFYVYELCEILP
jgi:hypothetical protein